MARITESNIIELQEKLLSWYITEGRRFPWRKDHLSHYQLIIAEVLLQRTKAETVANFYLDFLKMFPSWMSLAKSSLAKIESALKPIGLQKQRSKRLKALAVEMIKMNEKIPATREELDKIPFFGQYIVNAIELLILNRNRPLLDVNMSRVLERYFKERQRVDIRYDPFLQSLAQRFSEHSQSKFLNWAILDFAALVCRSRQPRCFGCVLARKCSYAKTQLL